MSAKLPKELTEALERDHRLVQIWNELPRMRQGEVLSKDGWCIIGRLHFIHCLYHEETGIPCTSGLIYSPFGFIYEDDHPNANLWSDDFLDREPDPEASLLHCSKEQEESEESINPADFEDPIQCKALNWTVKHDRSQKRKKKKKKKRDCIDDADSREEIRRK